IPTRRGFVDITLRWVSNPAETGRRYEGAAHTCPATPLPFGHNNAPGIPKAFAKKQGGSTTIKTAKRVMYPRSILSVMSTTTDQGDFTMAFKTAEKGQALILIAFTAIALFGFAALAIDGARSFSDKRHAQNAADTSA